MSKFKERFFESHDAESEAGIMNGFVIATNGFGWQMNPIGLRIDVYKPDDRLEEPAIVAILFWAGRIRIITTICGDVESLRHLFAEYDFFPSGFRKEEIARLEKQLETVRKTYQELIAERSPVPA